MNEGDRLKGLARHSMACTHEIDWEIEGIETLRKKNEGRIRNVTSNRYNVTSNREQCAEKTSVYSTL